MKRNFDPDTMKRPKWTTDDKGRPEFIIDTRSRLYLETPTDRGTPYVSSFGPNSEDSFSGFVPGITDPELAKPAALRQAARLWMDGPKDNLARRLLADTEEA
jgi:hypothetical protein